MARPDNVTEQGWKVAAPALPKKVGLGGEDESVSKPWKGSRDAYFLDILRWVVEALDEKIVAEVWPLVVPPILTLLDDWETKYKSIGAERLDGLLHVTPTALLKRTGLGDVFEEALMPCLTYLPPITPEPDAINLLKAVFPTLLTLSRVRYPPPVPSTSPDHRPRTKFLDTVLRKGVIYGYSLCSNYPRITSILFSNLSVFLNELAIDSVKHIKYILPMLTETLAHPLAGADSAVLFSALESMQSLIRNCWPRMSVYRGEVLKGLTLMWLKTSGSELKTKARETVRMLEVAVGTEECDFRAECAKLVEADGRLKDLLLEAEIQTSE